MERERAKTLELDRGPRTLPDEITCPDTGDDVSYRRTGARLPKKSHFACRATCGTVQDVLDCRSRRQARPGPFAAYAIQGYCPKCDASGQPYGGRFFAAAPTLDGIRRGHSMNGSSARTPTCRPTGRGARCPIGFMTHMNNGGISRTTDSHTGGHMFNHANCSSTPVTSSDQARREHASGTCREFVLGAFQQYLRNQNMFCIWDIRRRQPRSDASATTTTIPSPRWSRTASSPILGEAIGNRASSALSKDSTGARSLGDRCQYEDLQRIDPALADRLSGRAQRSLLAILFWTNRSAVDCRSSTDLTRSCRCILRSCDHRSAVRRTPPLLGAGRFLLRLAATRA